MTNNRKVGAPRHNPKFRILRLDDSRSPRQSGALLQAFLAAFKRPVHFVLHMVLRKDPFNIKYLTLSVSSRCPGSYPLWEHAISCLVSLALTLLFNICAVAACVLFSSVFFSYSTIEEADLVTYGDLGLIANSTSNAAGFSSDYAEIVSAAVSLQRGDRMLSPLWRSVSITYAPWTASFAFPGMWSLFSYVLGCSPFALLDFLDLPSIRQYKLQPSKHPAKPGSWMNTIGTTLLLQLVFPIPAMIGQVFFKGPWTYGYHTKSGIFCIRDCVWGASVFPVSAPTILETITQLVACLVVFDLGYYGWHSLHHISRPLYRNIHSVHHEYYAPFVWVTQYTHACELTAVATLSMTIPIAMHTHPLVHWMWLSLVVLISIDSHTGYSLPWCMSLENVFPCCGGTRHHDTHHAFPITNFQPFFKYADNAFGTSWEQSSFSKKKIGKTK